MTWEVFEPGNLRKFLWNKEADDGEAFRAEQIVAKLRQIESLIGQGKSAALACKDADVLEQTYCRWRKECGGLDIEQAKRMKELERENARLKQLAADLSLEKRVLSDIASGNF